MQKVALVLSGSSADTANLATEIEKADYVVRLHDSDWQPAETHGVKYNFGVLPNPWLSMATRQIKRIPEQGWLVYEWAYQKHRQVVPPQIAGRPTYSYAPKLTAEYFNPGLAPTRGFMAIVGCLGFFPKYQLTVYFGDSLRTGQVTEYSELFHQHRQRVWPQYSWVKSNRVSPLKPGRHDYEYESKLLRQLYGERVLFR